MSDQYFIILDEAPIKRHPTPVYRLMHGNIKTAVGYSVMNRHNEPVRATTIKSLLASVPKNESVYRVYLHRTDGKTGYKLIR
jgi:hypothetical protein